MGGCRVAEVGPSTDQILAEWALGDPAADLARWQEGMSRYEAGPSAGRADMGETAELMCAALTHYVAGRSIVMGSAGQSSEMAVARTVWNVLVAALQGSRGTGLNADSSRHLRLALAAARRGGYQSSDLGGNGSMSQIFDAGSRTLMSTALSELVAGGNVRPVNLVLWFTDSKAAMPSRGMTGEPANSASSAEESGVPGGSKWGTIKDRARQAQQNINPLALQHGIEAVQGALTGANVAKIDKNTGKVKIKKFGVAKAALRPAKTLRQALDGASLTEHLKSYNESSGTRGQASADAAAGRPFPASSPAEFASYGSKRDYLRDWARRLVVAAGVPPTEQLIVEHAEMAATAISVMVFLRLGAPRGISDLRQYFHDSPMPEGTSLDTFDELYMKVIEAEAGRQGVDERIVAFLNGCWQDWVSGIRDQHS
jgi:hypothetical protein